MASEINIPAYSDALVVLGTAGLIVPLLSRSGLSPVVGYLGAGALLGPHGLGSFIQSFPPLYWLTVVDAKNVSSIADLGVVFLLFLIGLELSVERLMTMRRLLFGLGGLQIAISSAVISAFVAYLGYPGPVAVVIGGSLALSSTAIVLEVLSREDRMSSVTGRVSFSVLLAQDLAVIPLLIFISLVAANGQGSVFASVGTALLQALIAVTIIIVTGRLFLRPLFRLVAATRSNELFIAATLFVILLTGVVAAIAGLSMALGAFIAGLLLAGTEFRRAIEATVQPFKSLLLGIFFFTVGMSIDVREIVREPAFIAAAVVGLITFKAVVVALLCRLFGHSWPVSIESALLLGPGGEFAFVGVGLASALGLIDTTTATLTLTVTSLSMALIPVMAIAGRRLATSFTEPHAASEELAVVPGALSGHAIVVGHGRMGKVVGDLFRMHAIPHIAVDHDPKSVTVDRRKGHDVYYGDATNRAFLEACGIDRAQSVVLTIQSAKTVDDIVAQVRACRPDIRIVSRARDVNHARHLYASGVSDAVPETVEASLQLSRAALAGMGVVQDEIGTSIKQEREKLRRELLADCDAAEASTLSATTDGPAP